MSLKDSFMGWADANLGTPLLADLAFGWLVPAISCSMIGVVLAYNMVWVFLMSGVCIVT